MTTPNPGAPLGMSDFFVLEAGEYLERLDALLQAPEGTAPAPDEFVRLARALRGSALMASQAAIARAASGVEALARAVREARRPWDAATRQIAIRAVDDLKIFVRRATSWTEADTAKAEALGSELEQLGGRPSAQIRATEVLGLDAGARAFVAREGAAIASALDRAGRVLRTNPTALEPLQQVLKALQPLRGLAALNDLPPLPDLLEGIERAIGELNRTTGNPPQGWGDMIAELFQMAATSIAHAAREVAERGRPDPESAEFRRFAGLLVKFMDSEPDIVPIETLGTIVRRGTAATPTRPATLGRLELVSHGEHLRQAADSLERAPSATQRELRAHTLGSTFRALANAGGGTLADRIAEFAGAAREAVANGSAVSHAAAFAAELRRVGDLLARASAGDEDALAAELGPPIERIKSLGRPGVAPVVPIETLAPAPPPPPARPATQPARPAARPAAAETPDLVGSWAAYERMVQAGVGPASLEELVALKGGLPKDSLPVVDVRTLLYRGQQGLKRAQELRAAAQHASSDSLRALVDEVCDLVALAVESNP